jgi:hypothetical protein
MLPLAAYFRAVRLLEQFKSVEDWASKLGAGTFTNEQKEKLRGPKNKQEDVIIPTPLRASMLTDGDSI